MTSADIAVALQTAFQSCNAANEPLSQVQQQILLDVLTHWLSDHQDDSARADGDNPLAVLTDDERSALMQFIQDHDRPEYSWKVHLLNDWLQGRDSGPVQFIRECYGLAWLEQVQPGHVADYLTQVSDTIVRLKVGDRIEVCNALWEWVQESGPCDRQWFPCTITHLQHEGDWATTCCTIQFEDGTAYELQGIYDWNRYNWRWAR